MKNLNKKTVAQLKKEYELSLQAEVDLLNKIVEGKFLVLTVALAKKYRSKNRRVSGTNGVEERNRNIAQRTVEKYVGDILGGRWKTGGAILMFDEEGYLINGQHTCTAVINADKSIGVFVMRNLPKDLFSVIDSGKVRSTGDVLSMVRKDGKKLTKPVVVSGAIKKIRNYERDIKHIEKDCTYTNEEMCEQVENDFYYYEFPFSLGENRINKWRSAIGSSIPASTIAAIYFMNKKQMGDKLDVFFNTITNAGTAYPLVMKFRDKMVESKGRSKKETGYISDTAKMILLDDLLKAYKADKLTTARDFSKKARELYRRNNA